MTYYFIENDSWRLIGVGASAQVKRDEYIAMNLNGSPYSDMHSVEFSTYTLGGANTYLNYYFDNMSWNPSACLVKEIGSFNVDAKDKNGKVLATVSFAPIYARYPIDLT